MTFDPSQIVAVLMPEQVADVGNSRGMTTVMVRDGEGQLSVHTLSTESALARQLLVHELNRKRVPIIDPVSRQLIGYETR